MGSRGMAGSSRWAPADAAARTKADTTTGAEILDLLRDLNTDGTTLVVITHDLQVAAAMHRRIELRDGRIVHDSGTAA